MQIPCKHVFCLACGRQEEHQPCPRCRERVVRVEQTSLGQVFMCTHGGSRYGNDGCRRTYLSQRDLQAHINHRHLRLPLDKDSQKIGSVSMPGSRAAAHQSVLHARSNHVSVTGQEPPVGGSSSNYFNNLVAPTSASYSLPYSSTTAHYASSSFYANYQQPAPPPPPPAPPQQQQHLLYDSSQTYSNQWSTSTNQSYYR